MGCAVSIDSNAAADMERRIPDQLALSQKVDDILMESFRELNACSQWNKALEYLVVFIVERLCHAPSWREAWDIISAGDNQDLAACTRSVIDRKRSLSQEGNVVEVVTDEVTEAMPDVATAVATGGAFLFPLPILIPQNHQELRFLSSVCHGQDKQIMDLLGGLLKLQVENDKLEFLVERLCLPMNFAMALKMFEAAKIEMNWAFIKEIAKIEKEAAKTDERLASTHEGKLRALLIFTNKVAKIEALSAFTNTVKDRRPHQARRIIAAFEKCIVQAPVVTEVRMNHANRLRQRQNGLADNRVR